MLLQIFRLIHRINSSQSSQELYESVKNLGIGEDDDKFQYFEKDMKGENPLIIPMKLGWQRQIAKFNNNGRRQVFYIAPCGRRLRSLEEVHRYLRVTKSNLEIDFFNFEW